MAALLSRIFGRVGSLCCHGDVEELMGWNSSQGWRWNGSSGCTVLRCPEQKGEHLGCPGSWPNQLVGSSGSAAQRAGMRCAAGGLSSCVGLPPPPPPSPPPQDKDKDKEAMSGRCSIGWAGGAGANQAETGNKRQERKCPRGVRV